MSAARSPATGIRFALCAMVCFAAQDGASKHLVEHYPAPFFVMIRYWFFAAFVCVLAARGPGGIAGALQTRMPITQIARGVLLVSQILIFVWALDLLGLSLQMSIFALYPLIVTALAWPLLGERFGWRRLAALGVGFTGVLVILRPGFEGALGWEALIGVASAVGIAIYSVLTRIVTVADGTSSPAFVYTGLAGAAAVSLVGPFYWTPMPLPDWGWLGVLCLAGMAGHYCLIRAYDATEAYRIQPLTYLQPVFGIGVGVAVFGETVDATALLGVTMIVTAGLYVIWREWRLTPMRD